MSDDWLRDGGLEGPSVRAEELCPHCGEPVAGHEAYCPGCGEALSPPPRDDDALLAAKNVEGARLLALLCGVGLGIALLGVLVFSLLWPLVRDYIPH